MTRIRVVLPLVRAELKQPVLEEAERYLFPGTTVDVVHTEGGTESIESCYDEIWAGPGIVRCVDDAVADGVDGVFVTCFGDPAVHAARERSPVPVVGGFEPAVLTAMSLADRFAIVTVLPNVVPIVRRLLHASQIAGRCAAMRPVDMPVLDLGAEHGQLGEALLEQSLAAVRADGAEAIVLGCTGMLGVADRLERELAEQLGVHVPVVDPTAAALTWLQSLALMGRRHSAITYMEPPAKQRGFAPRCGT